MTFKPHWTKIGVLVLLAAALALVASPSAVAQDTDDFHLRQIDDQVSGVAAIAAFDANGDDRTDLAILGTAPGLFLNDSQSESGFIRHPLAISLASNGTRSLKSADIDDDGDLDLLAPAFTAQSQLAWLVNDGGSFAEERIIATAPLMAKDFAPADIDGDGDMDIVVAAGLNIGWLENDGASPPNFTIRLIPNSGATWRDFSQVEVGDFDGDGDTDIMALTPNAALEYFAHQNASMPPQFAPNIDPAWNVNSSYLEVLASGDFDGNGIPEICVGGQEFEPADYPIHGFIPPGYYDESVTLLTWAPGSGGSFYPFSARVVWRSYAWHEQWTVFGGALTFALKVADMDGDGRDDLVIARQQPLDPSSYTTPYTLTGAGWVRSTDESETWTDAGPITLWHVANSVAAADFSGDGRPDVAAYSIASGFIVGVRGLYWAESSVSDARARLEDIAIVDASGDGFLLPGERGVAEATVQRSGLGTLQSVSVNATGSPLIEFDFSSTQVEPLAPGASATVIFPFIVAQTAPCGAPLRIDFSAAWATGEASASAEPRLAGVLGSSQDISLSDAFAQDIPGSDGPPLEKTLTLDAPAAARLQDVSVEVNIAHGWRGDLEIRLYAPTGEQAVLFAGAESDNGDNVFGTFEAPEFFGLPAAGVYTLWIDDRYPHGTAGTGHINFWTLNATFAVPDCAGSTSPEVPALSFQTASLEDWDFLPGDGSFTGPTEGVLGGHELGIRFPSESPDTALFFSTGIWSNDAEPMLAFEAGQLYAVRAELSANQPADYAASTRLRVQTVLGSVDQTFNINDAEGGPFGLPSDGSERLYLAYFRPFDLDANAQNILAFDGLDNGNALASTRVAKLHALEIASSDAAAFLGSGVAISAQTEFSAWEYVNFGSLDIDGLTLFEGGQSGTENGRLQHLDDDGPAGGAAEWLAGDPFDTAPGALYRAAWKVAGDDGGDGTFPGMRLNPRSDYPALSVEYFVRGDGPAFDALAGQPGDWEQFWVGHKAGGDAGPLNDFDDMGLAFGLLNFAGADQTRGGMLDLFEVRVERLAENDPNLP